MERPTDKLDEKTDAKPELRNPEFHGPEFHDPELRGEDRSPLPLAELNPLMNPVLSRHMGRWAEVYFTTPPEKRDEAVLELLRELSDLPEPSAASEEAKEEEIAAPVDRPAASQSGVEFPTFYSNGGRGNGSPVHGDPTRGQFIADSAPSNALHKDASEITVRQQAIACEACGAQNRVEQRFCGMCGLPLNSAFVPAQAAANSPSSAPAPATAVTTPMPVAKSSTAAPSPVTTVFQNDETFAAEMRNAFERSHTPHESIPQRVDNSIDSLPAESLPLHAQLLQSHPIQTGQFESRQNYPQQNYSQQDAEPAFDEMPTPDFALGNDHLLRLRHSGELPAFARSAEPEERRFGTPFFVGAAIALILGALIYIGWRGQHALSASKHPQPPARSVETTPETLTSTPAPIPDDPQPPAAQASKVPASADNSPAAVNSRARTAHASPAPHPPAPNPEAREIPPNQTAASEPLPSEQPPTKQPASNSPVQPASLVQSDSAQTLSGSSGWQELETAKGYLNGAHAGVRNSSEAAKWLWKSVGKKNLEATVLLSDLYLKGDGVQHDCDQARLLLDAAARKHSASAAERLRNLQAFGCQ